METIYIKSKCSKCSKTYDGVFRLLSNGTLCCVNCDDIKKYSKTFKLVEDVSSLESELENNSVKEMLYHFLEKDMKYIYNIEYEFGENYENILYDENGIDPYAFYFQNNPLDIVVDYHYTCYKGYNLIGMYDMKINDISYELLERYKTLRIKKLNEAEIQEYREFLNSKDLTYFKDNSNTILKERV